jgi:hypothetical protein
MAEEYAVLASNKTGLSAGESYIVVRNGTSFLRVLGRDPHWQLMTATASEDDGAARVCRNQIRLTEAALRLGAELGTGPKVQKDRVGREYVKICNLECPAGRAEEFDDAVNECLSRFFSIFDGCRDVKDQDADEMRELYDMLAAGEHGGDVYLSDGLWLSSDGAVHDRGR